jgi:putative FmdB family regulatory protein
MPIFDFACDQCGHSFEKLVSSSQSPSPNCLSCDSNKVTKQVSAPAFRLAGSGWYETDFKTGKKKNLVSDANASEKKAKPVASAAADSKK